LNHDLHAHPDLNANPSNDDCPRKVNQEIRSDLRLLLTAKESKCPNMTWHEANDFCEALDMVAVNLGDDVDQNDIQDILKLGSNFWTSGWLTRSQRAE